MKPADAKRIQRMGGKNSPMKFKKGDKRAADAGRKGGTISRKPKAVV